jgi:uncharacterized protein YhaN
VRLERLGLTAFGPFTGDVLDLSGGTPGGLHVIYGENEAGKSTALRGVTGLLYGFPERTEDAHLHPTSELSISALVSGPDGTLLEIVRRKKRKDSLRGFDDAVIDESELVRLLGGVDQATFSGLFGIDHQQLKRGGEALLAGGGDVGESLFEAGVGGRSVHEVLTELTEEADRLFKPRARTSRINAAVGAYRETVRRMREAALLPEKWQEQAAELERLRREREAFTERLGTLRAEQHRLKRVLGVLGRVAKRRERREELEALGPIAALPADAGERREHAQRLIWQATRDIERLEAELRERSARQEALATPETLLALGDETARHLADQLAIQRRAMGDLQRRELEIRVGEDDARTILRRIGRGLTLDDVEALRLSDAEQVRIKKLATEHALTFERLSTARREHRRIHSELEQRRAAIARIPPPLADVKELERALSAARSAGDLENRTRQTLEGASELDALIAARFSGLVGFYGSPADIETCSVPLPETIEEFRARRAALELERGTLEQERRAAREHLDQVERQISGIESQGEVPSEEQLSLVRQRRGDAVAELRRVWLESVDEGGEPVLPGEARALIEAAERALAEADEVSDRLRREAGRVAELASLSLAREQHRAASARLDRERKALSVRLTAVDDEWAEIWKPVPVSLRSPAEMSGFRRRYDELTSLHEQRATARRQVERLEAEQQKLAERLAAALGAAGCSVDAGCSFAELVEQTEARRREVVERAHERISLQQAAAELERRNAEVARELSEREAAAAAWQSAWEAAVEPLKLSADPEPEEALAVLEQLAQLFLRLEKLSQVRQRAEGIRRNQSAFVAEVAALVETFASDLKPLAPEQAAEALLQGYNRAREESGERARLDEEIEERWSAFHAARQSLTSAEAELGDLMRTAGVPSAAELEVVEQRARRARELDREIRELEDELLEAGEGMSLQELLAEASASDRASVVPRLDEIEREIEETREAQERTIADVTRLELGLRRYELDEESSGAAQEGALLAAEIRSHVERYLRLRVASAVLEREIERYREKHQGPVLTRAAELFPRLTLGGFRTLRVGREEPVLICVRADGSEVEVAGLSEGTQYQLYLALRLATIERYLENSPPLPLVLDDLLLHFDDPRARAALEVLGELAGHVQILFFTHLMRDLELARQVVPQGRLFEHRLETSVPARSAARARTRAKSA